ncbi:MAG: PDZ domain-containing protein [Anaerolineae bacterium]|nr:PDZ domain-containing protein [Anaerolineae bacterium]
MQTLPRKGAPGRSAHAMIGLAVIMLPLAVGAGYLLPSPVALVTPGPVEPVDTLITIAGRSYEPAGRLYLTSLRLTLEPRLGHFLLAQLHSDAITVPREEVVPAGVSREELLRLSQRLLAESHIIAQAVALRQAGYEVRLGSAQVEVVATVPGTPAEGHLEPGDVIEAVDGESIATTAELVSIVQGRVNGEPVTLRVRRGRQSTSVTLRVLRGPLDTEGPVLGAVTVTRGLDCRAPLEIKVDGGPLSGGPSGGLIYALGIYNALATEDITRGHRVAGAGTLRLNGTVGPTGGVPLKVRAAEDAGAEYFLVPAEDEAAARAAANEMEIIPVHTFRGALEALKALDAAPGRRGPAVPTRGDTTLAHNSQLHYRTAPPT